MSYVMCHLSCVMCHMSGVMCHLSYVTCNFFFSNFFINLVELVGDSVEGLLSTGPTPSSFSFPIIMIFKKKKILSQLKFCKGLTVIAYIHCVCFTFSCESYHFPNIPGDIEKKNQKNA